MSDVSYSQVHDIFSASCSGYCHTGGGSYTGGLDLSSYTNLMSGYSNHGPVVISGDADNSILIQKLQSPPPFGDQMPLDQDPLDHLSISIIATWINEGANNDGEEPEEEFMVVRIRMQTTTTQKQISMMDHASIHLLGS